MKSVHLTITDNKLIAKGSIIGCAVSGGSDSMCLLHYLFNTGIKSGDFSVICINVEHGIRGENSVKDTQFVKDYCRQNNIGFAGISVDVPKYAKQHKKSVELAARELRYGYFSRLIKEGVCDSVAVAHNKEDNAESVLMHIFRGSALAGARNMDFINPHNIIRPLLNTDKREILQYLQQNNVPFIQDDSNFDNAYNRNYIRNAVLPQVEERFPGVSDNIMRFSLIVGQEDDYLNRLAGDVVFAGHGGFGIRLPAESVLLRRAAVICLHKLGVFADYSYKNLYDIVNLSQLLPGASVDVGNDITAYREKDSIYFCRGSNYKEPGGDVAVPLKLGLTQFCGYLINVERSEMPESFGGALYMDADKVPKGSEFRFRLDGDTFKRYKGKGKLLSDYFTDIGLPVRLRSVCPLLCRDKEVLAVLPADISDSIKLTQKTKNIYKITFSGGAASELIQRCREDTNNKGTDRRED